MGNPVVHFEIIGADPAKLRSYYGQLFGWEYTLDAPVAPEVSQSGEYAFIDRMTSPDGSGIPGGVGGGHGFVSHTVFYIAVDNVEQALQDAERLGGTRVMGPARNDAGGVVVGHFADPEGNLVGVAGPA
jgi:predicted enzyme related to lactoylglutathione lyase